MLEYITGDILEVNSYSIIKGVTFSKHYGILFFINDVPYITHNSFSTGKIEIEPFEKFIKGRKIYKVLNHVNLTDKEILYKSLKLQKEKKYNFFTYNCEDYIKELCKCNIGFDQRIGWFFGLVFFIIILYIIFK